MANKAAVNDGAGTSVSVRLKSEELAALDEIAARDGISRAEALRRLVIRGAGSLPGGEEFSREIEELGDSRARAGRIEGRLDRVREVEATQRNAAAVLVHALTGEAKTREAWAYLQQTVTLADYDALWQRARGRPVAWTTGWHAGREVTWVSRASVLQAVADAMRPADAGPRILPTEVPRGKLR